MRTIMTIRTGTDTTTTTTSTFHRQFCIEFKSPHLFPFVHYLANCYDILWLITAYLK